MNFEPQTADQIAVAALVPAGEYKAVVTEATEKTSSSGNPMVELELTIEVDGSTIRVWDYLSPSEKSQWKLRTCCVSADLINEYNTGQLSAEIFVGRVVTVDVLIKKDNGYSPKNVVRAYFETKKADETDTVAETEDRRALQNGKDTPPWVQGDSNPS